MVYQIYKYTTFHKTTNDFAGFLLWCDFIDALHQHNCNKQPLEKREQQSESVAEIRQGYHGSRLLYLLSTVYGLAHFERIDIQQPTPLPLYNMECIYMMNSTGHKLVPLI